MNRMAICVSGEALQVQLIWVNTAVKTQALPQQCLISHETVDETEILLVSE